MVVELSLNTPLADALMNVVQAKLSELGWTTGDLDDSALGEYVILMLVNGKNQEQIATELSTDLLGLAADDTGAAEFAKWLFEQTEALSRQVNGKSATAQPQVQPTQAISSFEDQGASIRGASTRPSGDASGIEQRGGDTAMGEAEPNQDGSMYVLFRCVRTCWNLLIGPFRPTGPKSMRNTSRPGNRRIMGQLSKAMDRSGDAALHRVRPQQGTERINMHNRQPPKGPKGDQVRSARAPPNGRSMSNGGMPNGAMGVPPIKMTPQQQMQLMAMYEQQAAMMSQMAQMFPPQQQQAFMPSMGQPAMNPAFQNGGQQHGRSLFERVEGNPHRQNGVFNRNNNQNGSGFHANMKSEPGATSGDHSVANGDLSSSMEVESSQNPPSEPSPDTICRFNLSCTKKDCPYAHQSPAAPPGTTIDVTDNCPFGAACKNKKCVGRHPSPSQKLVHQSEQECKFYPNCTNPSCPFRHPTMPPCKFGADCSREGCKFTHLKTMCKFNPCLNAACIFKHAEGQKRGAFGDKVWTADQEKEHVSERKFVDDEMAEEELVVPEPEIKREDLGVESQNSTGLVT